MGLLQDIIEGAEARAAAAERQAEALLTDKPGEPGPNGEETTRPATGAERAKAAEELERARQLRHWAAFARKTPDAIEQAPMQEPAN